MSSNAVIVEFLDNIGRIGVCIIALDRRAGAWSERDAMDCPYICAVPAKGDDDGVY